MAENANPDVEEWQSVVKGGRSVARFGEKGEKIPERIAGGDRFYVTPEERRRNESQPRSQADNPFKNGAFKMLRCVETDEDSKSRMKAAAATPKDDAELLRLLDSTWASFETKFKKIKEVVTVDRIYNLARKNEIGGNKMKLIQDTLRKMSPQTVLVGDNVAAGAEAPPNGTNYRGPAANIDEEIERDAPREYALDL